MNKSDLIHKLTFNTNSLTKQDIETGIGSLIEKISLSIQQKKRIEIRGFGSFTTRKRKARLGRNPKTGTSIAIDSRYHANFKASKLLKRDLNE